MDPACWSVVRMHTHKFGILSIGRTLLKQTLADISDGEESIEPKFVGVHATDKQAGSMKLMSNIS